MLKNKATLFFTINNKVVLFFKHLWLLLIIFQEIIKFIWLQPLVATSLQSKLIQVYCDIKKGFHL